MAGLLYECAIRIYVLLIRLAAFFVPKARLWVEGRRDWQARLAEAMAPALAEKRKVAWFHAASLGEFEQGRPVMEAFRKEFPGHFILLTFYSPSGYEIRRNYPGADYICYLPADTASNARDFVMVARPNIAFFIKYEFWYNYLNSLKKEGTAVVLFSAIFRENQVFFQWWGGFYRSLLLLFDAILVQNARSAALLGKIEGLKEVLVAGDTRFDRVAQLAESGRELEEIRAFAGDSPCLVVGSAWAQDMDVVIPALDRLEGRIRAIIAPHEINREEIAAWQAKLRGRSVLYSDYKAGGFIMEEPAPGYIFIDNIGMLSALYRYGSMAFIGGAFGKGLHNTLEAATWGMPIFFGNRSYARFSEAVDLLELGVAQAVGTPEELGEAIENFLSRPAAMTKVSLQCRQYVASHTGATEKVMQVARELLTQSRNSSSAR